MREVWSIARSGSLDRLRREREAVAPPGPGEVSIDVKAIGLNFADIFACMGLYSATPRGRFVPGLECAGVILDVGAGVTGYRPGQAVIALTRFGAYATHVVVDARYLRPLPDGWSFAQGAALAVQAITAWYAACALGAAGAGTSVLVQSAAGGVGLAALGLLKSLGARVVATVGREAKRAFLLDHAGLTPDQVIVRDPKRFGAQLDRSLSSAGLDGFDLVLDAVMGPCFQPAYDRLRPAGRLVVSGAADLTPRGTRPDWLRLGVRYLRRPRLDPLQMISDNKSVMGFNLIWLWDRVDQLAPIYDQLGRHLPDPPHVGRRFPFAEAPRAMRALQSGGTVGKVVLDV